MESSEGKFENPQGSRRRSLRALQKSAKKAASLRVTSRYFARKSAAGQIVQKKAAILAKKKAVPEGDEEPAEGTKKIKNVDKHVTTVITHSLQEEKYTRLGADFYACDALDLAPRLLGKLLRRDDVVLQITEVEAYRPEDTACHGRFGQTARTEAMFRAGGHAYVYLCYGINIMLNVVADKAGVGAAVLIRACSPVHGLATIQLRRKQSAVKPLLLNGPGKVGQALGLTTEWSCHPLYLSGGLEILDGPSPGAILAGPRVGIEYAAPQDVAALWRFAIAGTPWISAPRSTLVPLKSNTS